MRRLAGRLDLLLVRLETLLVVVSLLLLIVLSTYQMIVRNLEQSSPGWIDPLLHQLVLWAGFLGASLAVRSRGHIRFDLLTHRLSSRWMARVRAVVSVASAGVCVLLAHASWTFVLSEREMSESTISGLPAWVFPVIIPAAFLLMAVHFLLAPLLVPTVAASVSAEAVSSHATETR